MNNIMINKTSRVSIYEQIIFQIKLAIAKKELKPGDVLPSIRVMAKRLSVSTLSVQRAYKELQNEKVIESSGGKGNYISQSVNEALIQEILIQGIEEEVKQLIDIAKKNGLGMEDIQGLIQLIWEEAEEEMLENSGDFMD